MPINLHQQDLPGGLDLGPVVAVDTEAMGLDPRRDRLCLVQLSAGDGECHLVQFRESDYRAPNLRRLLGDPTVEKLFHFARYDLAMIRHYLGVLCRPVYCTKVASKLARTYTDRHGLKELC
ncbi:MAG: ribonuclease D, partial [Geminicoccaceae bacterium]